MPGILCAALNLSIGGQAWSIVVLWSLWMVWSNLFAPALVEFNRISQTIKLIAQICILLMLINGLLAPGWAAMVVPIVCFSGLSLTGLLFFTGFDRQRQNGMPMLLLSAVCLAVAIPGLFVWPVQTRWVLGVMGALALILFAACCSRLGPDLIRNFRKYFKA